MTNFFFHCWDDEREFLSFESFKSSNFFTVWKLLEFTLPQGCRSLLKCGGAWGNLGVPIPPKNANFRVLLHFYVTMFWKLCTPGTRDAAPLIQVIKPKFNKENISFSYQKLNWNFQNLTGQIYSKLFIPTIKLLIFYLKVASMNPGIDETGVDENT